MEDGACAPSNLPLKRRRSERNVKVAAVVPETTSSSTCIKNDDPVDATTTTPPFADRQAAAVSPNVATVGLTPPCRLEDDASSLESLHSMDNDSDIVEPDSDSDLPPSDPAPPLPPAAMRVMFDFPATSAHRYDASRIPLKLVRTTVDVEVVEGGPHGRGVIARRDIEEGSFLGWFEGLMAPDDPLLDLHPYACSHSKSSLIVGSPLAWTSYVDDPHGTAEPHNVEMMSDLRRLSSEAEERAGAAARLSYWPYMRACTNIPAGARLLVRYGRNYWDMSKERERVYGRLAELCALLPPPTAASAVQGAADSDAMEQLLQGVAKQLQCEYSLGPVVMSHWHPLLLRQHELRRAGGRGGVSGVDADGGVTQVTPKPLSKAAARRWEEAWQIDLPLPARIGELPRGKPPPPPSPEVRTAMFAFPVPPPSVPSGEGALPAQGPAPPVRLSYQPADFSLDDIDTHPSIGLTLEPASGSVIVYALEPIPAGTRLGWFDGLVIPGSVDPLVNLHPYCVTRLKSRTSSVGDSIIGSPLCWVTHVAYERPQWPANVSYDGVSRWLDGSVDLAPDTRRHAQTAPVVGRWPCIYASRDIGEREVLTLPADPGYEEAAQERLEVFGALCELAARGAQKGAAKRSGRYMTHAEIDAEICTRFSLSTSDISLWEPLLQRVRSQSNRYLPSLGEPSPKARPANLTPKLIQSGAESCSRVGSRTEPATERPMLHTLPKSDAAVLPSPFPDSGAVGDPPEEMRSESMGHSNAIAHRRSPRVLAGTGNCISYTRFFADADSEEKSVSLATNHRCGWSSDEKRIVVDVIQAHGWNTKAVSTALASESFHRTTEQIGKMMYNLRTYPGKWERWMSQFGHDSHETYTHEQAALV